MVRSKRMTLNDVERLKAKFMRVMVACAAPPELRLYARNQPGSYAVAVTGKPKHLALVETYSPGGWSELADFNPSLWSILVTASRIL